MPYRSAIKQKNHAVGVESCWFVLAEEKVLFHDPEGGEIQSI
jgi:hypothetical protein